MPREKGEKEGAAWRRAGRAQEAACGGGGRRQTGDISGGASARLAQEEGEEGRTVSIRHRHDNAA